MSSPYCRTDHKYDISCQTSDRIEQQVIYIKASHPGKQLKSFYTETQSKAVEHGSQETPVPARHWKKKSKRNENDHISKQIGKHCKESDLIPVSPEPPDFFKQYQVIMVLLHFSCPAVPVRKYQKIYNKDHIQYK